jgi:hypothetical protein
MKRFFLKLRNSVNKRFTKLERFFSLKYGLTPSCKKTFFAVSMVKNEADIIELFLRINLRFFGKIYILDHHSDDTTPQIIQKLQAEGLPIEYILLTGASGAYDQAEITTYYINKIAREVDCDYIIPLDADEFIRCWGFTKPEEVFREATSPCGYCLIPWVTYVPINDLYLKGESPLHNNFRARNREPQQYYKVVMKRNFATTARLAMGNHDVISEVELNPKKVFRVILQHVPVRSSEQITSKVIIGSMAYKLKSTRKPGDGYHWDELAEQAIRFNLRLPHECVKNMAINYASPKSFKGVLYAPKFSLNPKIGTGNENIAYRDLAEINAEHNIEAFKKKFVNKDKGD